MDLFGKRAFYYSLPKPMLECFAVSASSSKYLYKTIKPKYKFQPDSNILAPPEAGRGNLLPYVLV